MLGSTDWVKKTYEIALTAFSCSDGVIQDSLQAGVIEPAMSKIKMLGFATEAAITILRIDDMVKCHPRQEEG